MLFFFFFGKRRLVGTESFLFRFIARFPVSVI